MEHEHGRLGGAFWPSPQHADVALYLGFEAFTHDVGEVLQRPSFTHLLRGDLYPAAFGETLGDLSCGGVVYLRQFTGDAGCRLARHGRPGRKHEAFGCITGCNTHASCLGCSHRRLLGAVATVRSGGFWGSNRRDVITRCAAGDEVLHQFHDVCDRGITQRLHLQRRNCEVMLDAVFNAHAHQRVEA